MTNVSLDTLFITVKCIGSFGVYVSHYVCVLITLHLILLEDGAFNELFVLFQWSEKGDCQTWATYSQTSLKSSVRKR